MVAITESLLEEITQRVVVALTPERVYLFGSRAYGTPAEDSDIDLLIVVPTSETRPIELARIARNAIGKIGCGVDVVVRSTDIFEKRASWPSNLEATVKSKGRLLYG